MSTLKEQIVYLYVIIPFLPLKKIKKIMLKNFEKFCENIRTKWTGFIRRQTCFISKADETIPPANEASSIGPYTCFLFFSIFSNVVFMYAARVLPSESAVRTVFSEILCYWTIPLNLWLKLKIPRTEDTNSLERCR